jgi:hypothetical protein
MRSDEYRRLHKVCSEMALQSDSENLQDRWLRIAQAWLDRANEPNNTGSPGAISLCLDPNAATSVSSHSSAIARACPTPEIVRVMLAQCSLVGLAHSDNYRE